MTLDHGKSAWGFWQVVTMSIVEMMYNPRFTGIHSSPKERQLQKCCVSFEKECNKWMVAVTSSESHNYHLTPFLPQLDFFLQLLTI